ncbi:MAG: hypothetical protein V4653_05430 [Pseudomonadota bacterium]
MFMHVTKALVFAGLFAWAASHLSDSTLIGTLAGAALFAMRMANLVPFATSALPMLLCGLVLAQGAMAALPMGDAVRILQNRLHGVSLALAAPLER